MQLQYTGTLVEMMKACSRFFTECGDTYSEGQTTTVTDVSTYLSGGQTDTDGDTLGDACDDDDDNDGCLDFEDDNSLIFSEDFDSDGIANDCDDDDDNDGSLDADDTDDSNAFVCSDLDFDGCNDCSSGQFDLSDDGPDNELDGLCDIGDPDDDNDGCLDPASSARTNVGFYATRDATVYKTNDGIYWNFIIKINSIIEMASIQLTNIQYYAGCVVGIEWVDDHLYTINWCRILKCI